MSRRIAAILCLDVVDFSAMMQVDSKTTMRDLNTLLRTVVRPAVRSGEGRIFKMMGDSVLAEFPVATGAVHTAAEILRGVDGARIKLRAGVHVGEVTGKGEDVFGDAVNIATRLQTAARPGNGLVSRLAAELAGSGADERVQLLPEGALRLKGIAAPVEAMSFDLGNDGSRKLQAEQGMLQDIRFATSSDGVRLAWTTMGEGPPLVRAPTWISHLEHELETINGQWQYDLAETHRLIRFDQRGNGLSDRAVEDISLERFLDDLETVMTAAQVERAPLFCRSQGAAIGAAFAVRYPERVTGLVILGGFVKGPLVRSEPRHVELTAALDAMARVGWDDDYPSVRDHFATVMAPTASGPDQRLFAEVMHQAITAQDFARFREKVGQVDVSAMLSDVKCPALVLHGAGDRMHPIEQGRSFAAGITQSHFIALPTSNHIMPRYDPAWSLAMREISRFLAELPD